MAEDATPAWLEPTFGCKSAPGRTVVSACCCERDIASRHSSVQRRAHENLQRRVSGKLVIEAECSLGLFTNRTNDRAVALGGGLRQTDVRQV